MGVRAGAGERSTLQRCEQIKLIKVLRSGETEAAGPRQGAQAPAVPQRREGRMA